MSTEFLADNNICGQAILQIVAEGNTIICELLRIKDFIPEIFRLKTKEDQLKYAEIILDFSYFQIADVQDSKIEENEALQHIDDELRENHIEILSRFYIVFESIHQYAKDLCSFIDDLNSGLFFQQTLESVLQTEEGKQLMCESIYLFGVMLLLVDFHIPGTIRERLLVSYNRYSAEKTHDESNIDEVCKLFRSTGFNNDENVVKKATNYPEDYFNRVPLNKMFVNMVIGRLRSDDVYNQISIYPLPEHRSIALANQAGMLFVCLFFSPSTLHNQPAKMREIVDKFFSDNWVVSFYMGISVNLLNAWDPFKAAKSALMNTFESDNLKEICRKKKQTLEHVLSKTRIVLKEGNLTEQKLLDNVPKVTALIRECNIVVRWIMLHTTDTIFNCGNSATIKKCKLMREFVNTEIDYKAIEFFEILLNTSQLELKIRDILKLLLEEKDSRWANFKQEACERINDLAEAFSGNKSFGKIQKNVSLQKWFENIHKEISGLTNEGKNLNISGRTIIQIIQALEEVQAFHDLNKNMQVKQYIIETRQFLHRMFHTINIKEYDLINLQLIGDFSYAWRLIDSYTPIMQDSIKQQPNLVIKLRSTFLKMASALEIPLMRLNQAESENLVEVSKFYSNELAHFVRKVVQIIPETMFTILAKIIDLQTNVIKELPLRLEKDRIKEFAQLDQRFTVAKLTYNISTFTEGILTMKSTLVGVIELDPKQLLEDGIRKEFVKNVSDALHSNLNFNAKAKDSELDGKLANLFKIIDGYKRSFEYIQDYLNVHCLRIWNEEMQRVINYNVEKECNPFLRNKIQEWQSKYQSLTIPIPNNIADQNSVTFIGRLAREILRITDPKTTSYIELCTTWFDDKTHKDILTIKFAQKINETLGPAGLMGLDKLLSFMIAQELDEMLVMLQKKLLCEKTWIETLNSTADELQKIDLVENPAKFYPNYASKCSRIWPQFLDWIQKIGQKQIIRSHVAYELNCSAKLKSTKLESSLRTFNESILNDIKRHSVDEKNPHPNVDLVSNLNKYLEAVGLYNPYEKIYIKTKCPRHLSLFYFLFVISHLQKLSYMKNIDSLVAKKKTDLIDGFPCFVGLLTIFRQFPGNEIEIFIQYLVQYVMSYIEMNLRSKQELCMESLMGMRFLEIFVRLAEIPRSALEKYIPDSILNQYEFLSNGKL